MHISTVGGKHSEGIIPIVDELLGVLRPAQKPTVVVVIEFVHDLPAGRPGELGPLPPNRVVAVEDEVHVPTQGHPLVDPVPVEAHPGVDHDIGIEKEVLRGLGFEHLGQVQEPLRLFVHHMQAAAQFDQFYLQTAGQGEGLSVEGGP